MKWNPSYTEKQQQGFAWKLHGKSSQLQNIWQQELKFTKILCQDGEKKRSVGLKMDELCSQN